MLSLRLMGALLGCMVINLNMTTCRSSGDGDKSPSSPPEGERPAVVELPGVDTAELTAREKLQWSSHVTTLLAPCEKTPSTVAECVQQKKECAACLPAAKFLLRQVQQGKTPGQTEAAYEGRFADKTKKEIEVGNSPIQGSPDAPITIVEFADFECPACRAATPIIDDVLKESADVRLVFKNFPLSMHPNAEVAARAAVAAGLQGKFWGMHHQLFTKEPPLSPEVIRQLAQGLELDMTKFGADMRSEAVADAVAKDRKLGESVNLSATPTIFIDGRLFDYQGDMKTELLEWIELERQLLGLGGRTGQKAAAAQKAGTAQAALQAADAKSADPKAAEAKSAQEKSPAPKAADKPAQPGKAEATE